MKTKKFLSVLLTLLMMLGVIAVAPITASAAETSVGNETALLSALAGAADGDTIKLTADIVCNTTIELPGQNMTVYIDLNSFTLEAAAGVNIDKFKTALLLVDPDNGEFNATGSMAYGFYVNSYNYSKVEVSNVIKEVGGWPMMAQGYSEVVVYGNVAGVNGGVSLSQSSTVTIEGTLTVTEPTGIYIQFEGGPNVPPEDYVTPTTKTGYLTYTDDENTVWVRCHDHDFGAWVEDTAATHTATGTQHRICALCGYRENGTIPVVAHEFGAAWVKDATNHWYECDCGEKSGLAAHSYGAWVTDTEPTATVDGSKHRTCSECGYVENGTIPATGEPEPEPEPESCWQKIVGFVTGNWLWIAIAAIGAGGAGAATWLTLMFWKVVAVLGVIGAALVGIFLLF